MTKFNNFKITKKQRRVSEYIMEYIKKNGISPTIREIQDAIKAKSVRTVTQYLEALEKKGLILRNENKVNRNIELIKNKISSLVDVPVFGSAGCDNLEIFADQNYNEFLKIDKNLIGNKEAIAVKAQGSSMIEAGIQNGDFVLIEKNERPENGEIVLAVVDGMAVIKKLNYSKNAVILSPEPATGDYKPIIIKEDNLKICGRVLDIIKDPKNEEIQYIKISE